MDRSLLTIWSRDRRSARRVPLIDLISCILLILSALPLATAQEESPRSRGIQAFEDQRYDDAISLLEQHVDEEPDAKAYTYLGHAYYFQNSYDRARRMYKNAREQGLPEHRTKMYLARITIARGHPLKALSSLRPLLNKNDIAPLALRLFGRALEKTKTYDLSATLFRRLLLDESFEDDLLEKMYQLSMKEEQYGRAKQYLNLLQMKNELNTDYLLLNARASLKQGTIDEAEVSLELARRLGRFDSELYRTIADIKSKNEQFLDAVHFYKLLLNQTDNPSARDQYRLGISLLETGQLQEAEPYLFDAARNEASYANGVLRLIRITHENRSFDRVKKLLSKAREAFPELADLHSLTGNLFLEAEQPNDAFNAFSKLDPEQIQDRGTLYNYIYSAMQTNANERAFELLSTAIAQFPEHKPFRTLLDRLVEQSE